MKPKFYVTTPIYYVNDAPHIGHAYTTIACDVLARFKRLDGYDVFFLTGTDEHGQKVEKAAAGAGARRRSASPTSVSADFRDMAERMGISNDDFIRTTEERHKRVLRGAVAAHRGGAATSISAHYEGWYAVRDEAFYDEGELTTLRRRQQASRRAARRSSGCASRAISSASRPGRTGCCEFYESHPDFIAADDAAQRGAELRAGRAAGSLGQPHQLHAGAFRCRAIRRTSCMSGSTR